MTLEGVDYSFARPGGKALAAAGKHFAMRYLTGVGKALTAPELDDLHAHDIAVGLIFESTASRALQGGAAGVADGKAALATATKLGAPVRIPVYFAVDFNATIEQQPTIDAYLRGAGSAIGAARVGVYGSYGVVKRSAASRSAAWYWQTYAWSAGHLATVAHVYQYLNGQVINGGKVDLCRALQADYGQWDAPLQSGPAQPAGDPMIGAENIKVGSDWVVAGIPKGTEYFDGPNGPKIGTFLAVQTEDYLGVWGPMLAVELDSAAAYADGKARPTIVAIPRGKGTVRKKDAKELEAQAARYHACPDADCAAQDAQIATLEATVADREDRLRRSSQITTL